MQNPLLPFFIGTAVGAYVLCPILLLVHELGHAWAVARTDRRSMVFVGTSPALISRRFERFDLHFHPWLGTSNIGRCVYDPRGLTVAQLRSITTAGPYATVASALVLSAIAIAIADAYSIVFWAAAVGAVVDWVTGIANLIPSRFEHGLISDGRMMARLQDLDPAAVPFPFTEGDG